MIPTMIEPTIKIQKPILNIVCLSESLSNVKRITASYITSVKNGEAKATVVVIRSLILYSSVDKEYVYSGTIKKMITFEANSPIANNAEFFAKRPALLDFIEFSLFAINYRS